jgi:hypothetical protein
MTTETAIAEKTEIGKEGAPQAAAKTSDSLQTLQQQLKNNQAFSGAFGNLGAMGPFIEQLLSVLLGGQLKASTNNASSIGKVLNEFQDMSARLGDVAKDRPLTKDDVLVQVDDSLRKLEESGFQISGDHRTELVQKASELYDKLGADAGKWTPELCQKFTDELGKYTDKWNRSNPDVEEARISQYAKGDNIAYGVGVALKPEDLNKLPLKEGTKLIEVHSMDNDGNLHVQGKMGMEGILSRLGGEIEARVVTVNGDTQNLFLRDPNDPSGSGFYVGLADFDWEKADPAMVTTLKERLVMNAEPIPTPEPISPTVAMPKVEYPQVQAAAPSLNQGMGM